MVFFLTRGLWCQRAESGYLGESSIFSNLRMQSGAWLFVAGPVCALWLGNYSRFAFVITAFSDNNAARVREREVIAVGAAFGSANRGKSGHYRASRLLTVA